MVNFFNEEFNKTNKILALKYLEDVFIEKYDKGNYKILKYFAPGRVNLIGEHTDYNGGYVFPCALSFGTFCLIRKADRDTIRFTSINMNFTTEVKLENLNKPIGSEWVNYPIGVIAQFLKKGLTLNSGCDLLFYGNVPNGAGLSSSASLEIATGYAINDFYKFNIDKIELAKMGQKAEHEFAGVNCGIMDQFTAVNGKKDHAVFLNCDTLDYELIPIILEDAKIIISDTNSPHKLDSGKYNERVAECKAAVDAIKPYKDINLLAEISLDEFKKIENNINNITVRKRARHVISEIKRTKDAVNELKKGNIEQFGKLMNESHDSLRDDYEVTGLHLDTMVDEARKIEGVIGTRMTGGGFGGCTVSIVKDKEIDNFISQIGKNYETKTGIRPDFYIIEIGDGAHKIEQNG